MYIFWAIHCDYPFTVYPSLAIPHNENYDVQKLDHFLHFAVRNDIRVTPICNVYTKFIAIFKTLRCPTSYLLFKPDLVCWRWPQPTTIDTTSFEPRLRASSFIKLKRIYHVIALVSWCLLMLMLAVRMISATSYWLRYCNLQREMYIRRKGNMKLRTIWGYRYTELRLSARCHAKYHFKTKNPQNKIYSQMKTIFTYMYIPGGHFLINFHYQWHLHYNEITVCVLYGRMPNRLGLRVFLILVRQLYAYLIACQLITKKVLYDSQENDQVEGIYRQDKVRQPCL